jgi:hypothetical protein
MFVLYTDGATEYSRDILAGEAALLEAVESAVTQPRGQAANAIRERIFNFEQIADDVAILTIRLWEKPQQRSLEALAERTGSRAARKTEQFQRAAPKAFRRTA